jgi:hypothetical protein
VQGTAQLLTYPISLSPFSDLVTPEQEALDEPAGKPEIFCPPKSPSFFKKHFELSVNFIYYMSFA